ncbi:MAG: hypothetical protein WD426_17295 [Anditalea sp.]
MDIQTMKITFIEEFLKLQDEAVIEKLTATLKREKHRPARPSVGGFAGILSNQDAEIFIGASQECRKIDTDGW